ncbi:MAG: dTDP-4-dehydrorhamnose 3,5-epimerase [Candidatus Dormibacteraeota bacterium]|nr:dTDP-4-dehydrorhamnose 3,5-epimerase [Candidatus Dormibacteraeota bacterium]
MPEVSETSLEGILLIQPEVHRDERGFFLEVFQKDRFEKAGIKDEFIQDNHSRSFRGALRGIHYQDMSAPLAKLVRCTAGRIFDVAVDLRVGSPGFGKWVGVELTDENMRQLYIPVGFGHGFLALSDIADLQYKCSSYYAPAAEGAVAWNDPDIGIIWPVENPIISPRDGRAPSLAQYQEKPAFRYPR